MTPTEQRIARAIIQLWSDHRGSGQREIARATAGKRTQALSQNTVAGAITRWEAAGLMQSQRGSNGRPGAARSFNWFGAPADATLRDAVAAFLADEGVGEPTKRRLRIALRLLFDLRLRAPDELILQACGRIPADQLYEFSERVYTASLERNPKGKQSAWNARSVCRAVLRYAATRGIVPVIFPRAWEEDAWEEATWLYFPNGAPDVSVQTLRAYRVYWRRLGEVAKQLFGPEFGPDQLCADSWGQVRRHLITVCGKRYQARQIASVLSWIGRRYGTGPLAAKWTEGAGAIGYNGRRLSGYLVGPNGEGASDGDWDTLLLILRHNGFPAEWEEFLAWYYQYSTLSHAEIGTRADFPSRSSKRHLRPRTLVRRVIGLRAWAYQAIAVVREREGLDAGHVSLEMAFGRYGTIVVRRLIAWWAKRAEQGEVSDATSDGLVGILKAGMMVARALYDRDRHEHGQPVVVIKDKALGAVAEESAAKSPLQDWFWRTYMECRNQVDALEEARKESPDGHVTTTAKDIQRMVEQTSPAYWEKIQFELLRRVREAQQAGEDGSLRYHRLVMLAFLLGLLISTGFRISETTHIRLGTGADGKERQYGPGRRKARRIHLRPVDRKNKKKHSAYLRERYCPVWIEQEWLERSRPFFMSRGSAPDHDWLLVDTQGMPYGCLHETDQGKGRDDVAHSDRIAGLRDTWIDQLMGVAADLGLPIPLAHGEFAPHAIRNVFGHLLFVTKGESAAAHYLGDSVKSIQDTYATVDGSHVDVSEAMDVLGGLSLDKPEVEEDEDDDVLPIDAARRNAARPVVQDYHTALKELRDDYKGGLLSRAEFDRAKNDLNLLFGIAA